MAADASQHSLLPEGTPTRLSIGFAPFLAVLLVMVATVTAGIYQVYSQYQVVRMGYAIDEELFEVRRLTETQKRLRLSIATYKHPKAVEGFARDQLGMRPPTPRDELIVPDGDRPVASPGTHQRMHDAPSPGGEP